MNKEPHKMYDKPIGPKKPIVPYQSSDKLIGPIKPKKYSGNPVVGLIVPEPPKALSKFASAGVMWANNVSPFLPYFCKFSADFLMLFILEESTA